MKVLKNVLAILVMAALVSPVMTGCGGGENEATNEDADTSGMEGGMMKTTGKAQNIFYAIPSPIELAQLIQKAGAAYNKDLLNDPKNVSKYNTNTSKALALGVYGADLSYTSVFDDNTTESIVYLAATRTLAESMGVGNAFNEGTVNRIQSNSGKKDSLFTIISDSYMSTDEMLKESQRESASALVIAGGFVEALYLGSQLAKTSKKPQEIINRIAEQKGTMDNVVALLTAHEADASVAGILADMKALQAIYAKVTVESKSSSEVKTNSDTKVTTIGGKITYTISPEVMTELTNKAAEIRTKIISGN